MKTERSLTPVPERARIDPDDVQVREARLYAPPENEVLRLVEADVEAWLTEDADPVRIGIIRAHVAWRGSGPEIADYADAEGPDEMALGFAVAEIMEIDPWFRSTLLINRIVIEPAYRGNGVRSSMD